MFAPVGWEGVAGGGEKSGVNIKLSEAWMLGLSPREACFVPQLECNQLLMKVRAPKESCMWKPWSERLL